MSGHGAVDQRVYPVRISVDSAGIDRMALKADNGQITPSRHTGAGRTKARSALNAQRAARRVSEANHPGNEATDGATGSRPAPG